MAVVLLKMEAMDVGLPEFVGRASIRYLFQGAGTFMSSIFQRSSDSCRPYEVSWHPLLWNEKERL